MSEILSGDLYKGIEKSRYVDDSKITDHYAIIPTGVTAGAGNLSGLEQKIYCDIIDRFLAVVLPVAEYRKVEVVLQHSNGIGNQRDLLYNSLSNRREFDGWNVLEFCDDGYSGTSFDHPGIQKLLSLAGNTVKCIIVKDLSRLGRNYILTGQYTEIYFPSKGVRYIAINDNVDTINGESLTF